jgi:hypothetical protein
MSPLENVGCPHCGSTISTPAAGQGVDDGRLKGTTAACRDCESTVELYYY